MVNGRRAFISNAKRSTRARPPVPVSASTGPDCLGARPIAPAGLPRARSPVFPNQGRDQPRPTTAAVESARTFSRGRRRAVCRNGRARFPPAPHDRLGLWLRLLRACSRAVVRARLTAGPVVAAFAARCAVHASRASLEALSLRVSSLFVCCDRGPALSWGAIPGHLGRNRFALGAVLRVLSQVLSLGPAALSV